MATVLDNLLASLRSTAPIQNVQNAISGWAAQNPTQAGNILNATGGSFGSMLQKSPYQVAASLAQPTVQKAVNYVIKAVTPTPVKAAITPTAPIKPLSPTVQKQPSVSFGQINQPAKPIVASPTPKPPAPIVSAAKGAAPLPSTYEQMVEQARKDASPYYQRLLEESNWDIEEAKRKLQEDYVQGRRVNTETRDAETKALFQQTIPEEQLKMAEDLNKRGLLASPTGKAQQLSGTLSTGEKVAPTSPVLGQQYGGIAGQQIGRMQTGQQARAEAIGRALSQREAELQLPITQAQRAEPEVRKRAEWDVAQKKSTAVGQLAGDAYQRMLQKQGAGLQTTYS